MFAKRYSTWIAILCLCLGSCQTYHTARPTETKFPLPTLLGGWWQPEKGLTWQIQFEGEFSPDLENPAQVYDLDLFGTDAETVAQLHEQGARVICYISAGTLENWVPDRDEFPYELYGKPYEGWPGETWLDIRQLDLLMPLLEARLDLCQQKGFDAVDPDNMDGWNQKTGFGLRKEDTLQFAFALAKAAHARGLAIGLKNSPELVSDLVDLYDFMITEEMFEQGWSDEPLPFLQTNKPVFAIEYSRQAAIRAVACRAQLEQGFSVLFTNLLLDEEGYYCP
jgi:hypothetical protein